MSSKIISRSSIIGADSLNELAKVMYQKDTHKQEVYRKNVLSLFAKTEQPSLSGLTFSIEVSGQTATSASIKVAKKKAGSIGTHVSYSANIVKAFTFGEISEEVLLQANTKGKTFLVQKIKDNIKKSKLDHIDTLNSLILSKSGEIGVTIAPDDTNNLLKLADLSEAKKLRIDDTLEVYSSAGTKLGTTFIVTGVEDITSSAAVQVKDVSADGTVSDDATLEDVVAGATVWKEGERAKYNDKFFGLYFWSPDTAARKTDVLNSKLKRSIYPNRLSGMYNTVDISGAGSNLLYNAFSKLATNAETLDVDVDCAIMHPRIYHLLNIEQHYLDRQATGSKIMVGSRQAPKIAMGSKDIEVVISPVAKSDRVIFFKKKSTFKMMQVGNELGELDTRDGLTFTRGESEALNDFTYTYRLRSFFNLCCEKPKHLIQLKIAGVAAKFA